MTPIAVTAGEQMTAAGSFRLALAARTFDTADPSRVEDATTGQGVVDIVHGRSQSP
jgi:hypothetical protein